MEKEARMNLSSGGIDFDLHGRSTGPLVVLIVVLELLFGVHRIALHPRLHPDP